MRSHVVVEVVGLFEILLRALAMTLLHLMVFHSWAQLIGLVRLPIWEIFGSLLVVAYLDVLLVCTLTTRPLFVRRVVQIAKDVSPRMLRREASQRTAPNRPRE